MKKRFYFFIVIFLFASFTFFSITQADAATRLSPFQGGMIKAPLNLALDKEGNLYITEPKENRLLILNRKGEYLKKIDNLQKPLGVAVDASGRIYISSEEKGAVSVYTPNLTLSHKLGAGNNEFMKPVAVAISNSGDIYVADGKANVVKVYGNSGSLKFSFGSPGSENGKFNSPTSIAIDDSTGEIIVSDQQVVTMPSGATAGARIQVFDKLGNFKRSFGSYGIGEGKITRPLGVAVDPSGNIYVSDSYQNVVHVFDSFGSSIDTLYDLSNPMRTPAGIAIGKDGRLFIASFNNATVEVYGLSGYTTFDVSSTDVFVSGQVRKLPAPATVMIVNSGSGTLQWTAKSSGSRVTLSATAGSTGPSSSTPLSISVNTAWMTTGTYTEKVTITSNSGATETVTVTYSIIPKAKKRTNPKAVPPSPKPRNERAGIYIHELHEIFKRWV